MFARNSSQNPQLATCNLQLAARQCEPMKKPTKGQTLKLTGLTDKVSQNLLREAWGGGLALFIQTVWLLLLAVQFLLLLLLLFLSQLKLASAQICLKYSHFAESIKWKMSSIRGWNIYIIYVYVLELLKRYRSTYSARHQLSAALRCLCSY